MKTCKTCYWFQQNNEKDPYGTCFYSAPPWVVGSNEQGPDIAPHHRCSKWESKRERRCGNCEFFVPDEDRPESIYGSCRVRMHAGLNLGTIWRVEFPITDREMWCGEFRGRE